LCHNSICIWGIAGDDTAVFARAPCFGCCSSSRDGVFPFFVCRRFRPIEAPKSFTVLVVFFVFPPSPTRFPLLRVAVFYLPFSMVDPPRSLCAFHAKLFLIVVGCLENNLLSPPTTTFGFRRSWFISVFYSRGVAQSFPSLNPVLYP